MLEDEQLELTAKLMALRQFIEQKSSHARKEFKSARDNWKMQIVRSRLVSNLLELFGGLKDQPALMFRNTRVTMVGEDAIDQGGVTIEMHSTFWRQVVQPEHGLFEVLTEGGAYLPRADANPDHLRAVGRVLLKSVLDDHPLGSNLSFFIFEYLSGAYEWRTFSDARPRYALQILANVDEQLASNWATLLDTSNEDLIAMGLTFDCFDDSDGPETPVDASNVAAAIVAGCRHRLLAKRKDSLQALRDGFNFGGKIELDLQLAQHRAADVALLLLGRSTLSTQELLDCFDWGEASSRRPAVSFLHELLSDEAEFDENRRFLMLRWCTGRNALPVNGLGDRVKLIEDDTPGSPDQRLPDPHTCSFDLDLPNYSSRDVLREKLQLVLETFEADPSFNVH